MPRTEKEAFALFDSESITVYQAYPKEIAEVALANQTFRHPFKLTRMTWIKPSFLWMMYRCNWGLNLHQERILAIKITHAGFKWALENACLSHFDSSIHESEESWKTSLAQSPVRVQWDPERDLFSNPQPIRSIQIGLSSIAVDKYLNEWIIQIDDITEQVQAIHTCVQNGDLEKAKSLLPVEERYAITFSNQVAPNTSSEAQGEVTRIPPE